MATATASPSTDLPPADVIRRHVKRSLPVVLLDDELLEIARDAAKKRRMLRQLEADLDAEKKKRNQQIAELQREIDTHDRELDTGEQERVVLCDEIFRAGTVYVRRSDTGEEFEPRPATAQEAQRYLPAVESTLHTLPSDRGTPPIEQTAAAPSPEPGEIHVELDEDDGPEDDGLTELTPAQIAVKEAAAARKARRKAGASGRTKS